MDENNTARLLREARLQQGFTQRQLALKLGVDEQTVRSWERGKRFPSVVFRPRLTQELGKSLEELGFQQNSDKQLTASPTIAAPSQDAPAASKQTILSLENRQRMIQRVRSRWITGILDQTLAQRPLIPLRLQELPEAVENPWHLTLQESRLPARALATTTRLTDVYDSSSGELLVLGEPGAGKTTLLLELARDLLERAEHHEQFSIPIVFHLSSWAERQHALDLWLIDELHNKYQIPLALARELIASDSMQLLLDGLDEVDATHRRECVMTINRYRQQHGLVPVVVCSRNTEYFAQPARLLLHTAIVIEPLTPEQIDMYLLDSSKRRGPLQKALQNDSTLREIASTPLMLTILMTTYESSKENLLSGSPAQNRYTIIQKYVERVLQRRGSAQRYTKEQTIHYPTWLAQQMHKQNQTEFYLERMQPDAVLDRSTLHAYNITVLRWIFGILSVINAGIFACFRGDSFPNEPGLFFWLGGGRGNTLLAWMAPGLGGGLQGAGSLGIITAIVAVLVALIAGAKELPPTTIQALRRALFQGLRNGLIIGGCISIVAGGLFYLAGGLAYGLYRGTGAGLFGGLIIGIMSSLMSIFGQEKKNTQADPARSPLKFTWLDRLLNSLLFSSCAYIGFFCIYTLQSGAPTQFAFRYGLIIAFFYCLVFGLGNGTRLIPLTGEIKPVETARWSWRAVHEHLAEHITREGLVGLLVLLSIAGVLISASSAFYGIAYGLRYGSVYGIIAGLITSIASLFTGILTTGWSGGLVPDAHQFTRPNEGIRRSFRNAVLAACTFGPLAGFASGTASALAFGLSGISGWFILGTGLMLIFTLIFTSCFLLFHGGIAVIKHYTLRWYLWRRGFIPRDYVAFLDHAAERILLRKIGGGYMFSHHVIQDYFASRR